MKQPTKPQPQQVRDYMQQRREAKEPPPSPERIRQELGWHMIEAQRRDRRK